MSWILLIIALGLLTLCSAFFSASETSLFSLSSTKVNSFRQSSVPGKKKAASLVLEPRDLLVTILMLNVSVNILVQNMASNLFAPFSTWFLSVGVPLVLTLVFGEIIPKSIAIENNDRIAPIVAPFIYRVKKLTGPLRSLIRTIADYLSQFLFAFLKQNSKISLDELQTIIKTSCEKGVLHQDEFRLIEGYLSLQESQIKTHMRPREEILYYNIHDPLDSLLTLFVDEECTRVPVCDNDFDHILGVFTAKDFLSHRHLIHEPHHILSFLSKPIYVPETAPAHKILSSLDEEERALALVVDEYGSVSGLITREDLIEEVVGEIIDRRDEKIAFTPAGKNVIIASGKMELADFNEVFKTELQSDHKMVTLGGWLIEQIGEIPKSGTNFTSSGFLFHILASEPNRIRRVYIRRLSI